jgi:hypothetical protein
MVLIVLSLVIGFSLDVGRLVLGASLPLFPSVRFFDPCFIHGSRKIETPRQKIICINALKAVK